MQQKGALIRSLLAAVEKVHGAAGAREVRDALPADVRAEIEPMVLAVRWYPVRITAEIQAAIRATVGKGSWEASHRLGVEAAKADFSSIYRTLFLRAVQYDGIWDRLERAWLTYNSQGAISWTDRSPGRAVGSVNGVSGFNLGIWHGVAGRAEGILTLSGAKSVATTVREATPTGARIEVLWLE